jgi:hypothetical protein
MYTRSLMSYLTGAAPLIPVDRRQPNRASSGRCVRRNGLLLRRSADHGPAATVVAAAAVAGREWRGLARAWEGLCEEGARMHHEDEHDRLEKQTLIDITSPLVEITSTLIDIISGRL